MGPIKVLVVDDSSVMRILLTRLLSESSEFQVVGAAPDPYVAREMILEKRPDVIVLDIEMPRMDGITFLKKIMDHHPIRTLIFSSLSTKNSEVALSALEAGAIDVMAKPVIEIAEGLRTIASELRERVSAVARARLPEKKSPGEAARLAARPRSSVPPQALSQTTHQVLAVAASTGGTEALKEFIPLLPSNLPGTVIVQHMPPVFTKTYANTLQKLCSFEVKEAEDGDKIYPGRALIAPGNFHMEIVRQGGFYHVRLHQQPTLHGVRPAADYLFRSVAQYAGANAVGVVLTGMGKDGAAGLKEMRDAGAFTVAQDEKSCVVFGMPKAAIEIDAAEVISPLKDIASVVMKHVSKREVKGRVG